MWLGIPCPLSCLMTGGPGAHPMSIGSTWHFLTPISLSFWLRLPLQLLWRCAWTWGALFSRATAGPSHLSPFCWLQCIFLSPLGRFSLLSGVFPTVYFFLLWSSALGAQLLHPLWFLLHQLFSISCRVIWPNFSRFCLLSFLPMDFFNPPPGFLQDVLAFAAAFLQGLAFIATPFPFCKGWAFIAFPMRRHRVLRGLGFEPKWLLSFLFGFKKISQKTNLVKSGEIMFWPDLTRFWPDLTRLEKMKKIEQFGKYCTNLIWEVPLWWFTFFSKVITLRNTLHNMLFYQNLSHYGFVTVGLSFGTTIANHVHQEEQHISTLNLLGTPHIFHLSW